MRSSLMLSLATVALLLSTLAIAGCRDVSRFSSKPTDHFEGSVVEGSFVRAGVAAGAKMCVTLDADHLQDAPGTITTADGRFKATALRPIPQLWHDPLSTLSFGDGRVQNLLYVATPVADGGDIQDIMVVMSLMKEGGIEVRLVRGAPQGDAGTPGPAQGPPVFGVFILERLGGACTF